MDSHREQATKSSVGEEEAKFVNCTDEAKDQPSVKLVDDLRNLVNNADRSDVVFVCQDGKHVSGSRKLLAGRSTVLQRMLTNGMAESSLSKIEFPEILSPVLLCIFEFLYTGTVVNYCPGDWRTGFEVIRAVRFLLIDHLEAIMWRFLWEQITAQRFLPGEAPEMLNIAMELEPLRDKASSNIILPKLMDILNSVLFDSSMLWNFSHEAFSYFLPKMTGLKYAGRLEEYARLRLIIMWHAVQRNPPGNQAERDIVDILVPGPSVTLTFFRTPYNVGIMQSPESSADSIWRRTDRVGIQAKAEDITKSPEEYLKSILPDENSRKFAATLLQSLDSQNLLSMIKLRQVPPLLLLKVVEPLKIFSPTAIKDALEHNAHLDLMVMPKFYVYYDYPFTLVGEGLYIQNSGNAPGLATFVVNILPPATRSTWSIEMNIDELSNDFLEFGLIHNDYFDYSVPCEPRLSDKRLSCQDYAWCLRMENGVTIILQNGELLDWKSTHRVSVGAGSKVVFSFLPKNACEINVNGTILEHSILRLGWGKTLCPAVCLLGGCVRFQPKKGFDRVLL